ncbi:hypothetical protein FNV43_RR10783 [Rhamnella rubrinervis]|uniref:PGG domain-containing protein n=1 Tax=Rhamnella rubrinervis TaxID=2594499 RepID=A0A8K0H4E6_9ROSA|nr:hypothetical protein FNV43_RR10783 [Rhamnella rubrinervis]
MGSLTKWSEWSCWPLRSRFKFDKERDCHSDARNVFASGRNGHHRSDLPFQAGVNPQVGVSQDKQDGQPAGRAIYASHMVSFYVFLISKTLALSSSIFVIISLTYLFPFYIEIAIVSIIITYGSEIFGITPHESVEYRFILAAAAVPFLGRFMIELLFKKRNNTLIHGATNKY